MVAFGTIGTMVITGHGAEGRWWRSVSDGAKLHEDVPVGMGNQVQSEIMNSSEI
jgi:hypothetical protein